MINAGARLILLGVVAGDGLALEEAIEIHFHRHVDRSWPPFGDAAESASQGGGHQSSERSSKTIAGPEIQGGEEKRANVHLFY
jgi:hypothetical protein